METKLNQEIKTALEKFDDKYFIDGVINKSKVIRDLDSYDAALVKELLSNDELKKRFTMEIAGATVIKVNDLIDVFEQDEYWQDSYTKYSKKIGLTVNGKFLDETSEVVLDFPYKDTVLKASMSKEDTDQDDLKPKEPFLNEVIARDEIDTLLSEKVLVSAKKYTREGSRKAKTLSDEDNLILKGNNLLGLYSIQERFANKVKMIYLDVPYFFKKKISEDSFKYNSNFRMSTWLVFLKNRLEIAKELLSEDGSIWINISDDGMHYLKVLADSVFGSESFVGTIPRKTRDGKSDVPFNFSQDFDWLLVYTKGIESDAIVGRKVERKYIVTDDFPDRPWRSADLTKQTTTKERENSNFTMVNPKTGKEYPANPKRSWAVTKDTFQGWYDKGGIGFPDDYDFMRGEKPFRRVFKDEDDAKDKPTAVYSDLLLKEFVTTVLTKAKNKNGNDEIDALFGRDEFDYAKPESLLKTIIEVATKENDVVLDFFMGSATTQAVAMKMDRRFIGIEQMDYINTISVPRLQKVIEGEQGGISKEVNWQGGGSFVYAELMEKNTGFIKEIVNAKDLTELQVIFKRMMETADFDFRVDLEEIQKDDLWQQPLDDQKRILIKVIDKNQLYYNYSEIDDENVRDLISDSDYEFNKSFYADRGE
ncbi:site-specific DNA-methyltransferase [Enterococcus faecalis]|uniref:site-specific DNA-methyltransferase n=1 Tax=Enterococcus faecalis TaxID=1351 RepID=UPI0019EBAC5F|nr:site-specific DNA-methyltransferase [Enterococcus faecalis]EGO7681663.1 site-specific DNA-methyltransferase [Enterococcus faecalis]EJX8002582.1 site-specific DNA-methyltransferase [Enterococcus faecalis]MDK4410064.1 site-specific DNA-methyltransferase [Enterococcus faecalis]MEB5892132.1 site-specific DNA-methyltransferase [Enterococcus faecalis]